MIIASVIRTAWIPIQVPSVAASVVVPTSAGTLSAVRGYAVGCEATQASTFARQRVGAGAAIRARPAPRCPEVDEDRLIGLQDLGLEGLITDNCWLRHGLVLPGAFTT